MSLRSLVIAGSLLLILGGADAAAQSQNDAAAESSAPRDPLAVTVQPLEREPIAGRLRQLRNGTLAIESGGRIQELAIADLLRVTFAPVRAASSNADSLVLLANGDQLRVRPVILDDEKLVSEWISYGTLPRVAVPLETIRGVIFDAPSSAELRQDLVTRLRDRDEESDLLLLTKGDRLTGELLEIGEGTVTLKGAVGETVVERAGIRAIAFNPALTSFPAVDGARAIVTLRDGSRITARDLRLAGRDLLEFEAVFGPQLAIPTTAVASLRFLGGRGVDLSDLEPLEYRFTPYLARKWPLVRDRNVTGGPLVLKGIEFAKGLGLHSRSAVTYDLARQSRRFRATVGLDSAAGPRGSAVFAVEVDGRRVFTSEPQRAAGTPLEIGPIDVAGATRLTLIVDYGPFGDVDDHANWVDAILIK